MKSINPESHRDVGGISSESRGRLKIVGGLAVLTLTFLHSPAHATPILWSVVDGGNGSYYDFVAGNISWTDAKQEAEGSVFLSRSAHLATITSLDEKEFVRLNISTRRGWLGGFQDTLAPDYSEPDGGWRWITDEPWDYTNWASPEPNEFVSGENYLEIDPSANSPDGAGWSDQSVTEHFNAGYYIEYAAPPVPEPSTYAMATLGLLGVGAMAWRKRSARRKQVA